MEVNINLIKQNILRPDEDIVSRLETRYSVTEFKSIKKSQLFLVDEEIKINGETKVVRRLYAKNDSKGSDSSKSKFIGVGWIINDDINICMVCNIPFGFFRWKHHCRCCGNIVCDSCSPFCVSIVELDELGEVRVCTQCYWGQEDVHINPTQNLDILENILDSDLDDEEEYYCEEGDNFYTENELSTLDRTFSSSELSSSKKIPITPVPSFVIVTRRLLSPDEETEPPQDDSVKETDIMDSDENVANIGNPIQLNKTTSSRSKKLVLVNVGSHSYLSQDPDAFVICDELDYLDLNNNSQDLNLNELKVELGSDLRLDLNCELMYAVISPNMIRHSLSSMEHLEKTNEVFV